MYANTVRLCSWTSPRRECREQGVLAECDAEGPDVLGDAAMLPLHNARLPEIVQEAGLPVVNMAHDGHNRWPWHQHTWIWWSCFHCVLPEANQNKT